MGIRTTAVSVGAACGCAAGRRSATRPPHAGNRLLFLLPIIFICFSAHADPIEISLEPNEYTIEKEGEYHRISMQGFTFSGSSGNPMLPYRIYNLAVPININWRSIKLTVTNLETRELEGEYSIQPVPPAATWTPERGEMITWGLGKNILNGRNINVYGVNEPVLKRQIELLPYSQMRKWKFIRLRFSPFNWNPVTKRLNLIGATQVKITYQTRKPTVKELILLKDAKFDDKAGKLLHNHPSAKKWYKSNASGLPVSAPSGEDDGEPIVEPAGEGDGEPIVEPEGGEIEPQPSSGGASEYVIITTSAIQAGSAAELANFVAHKESRGFTVEVVTEASYVGGANCDGRANNIRAWLVNNYASKGIEYVLLIGDPDPTAFDTNTSIPMKMCWPRNNAVVYTDYKDSPTDFFFADLTGNWNIDGDGRFGEYPDDFLAGGIDRAAEVFVGRIPFYGTYADLNSILQKIILYESDSGDISWRRNCLFAAGFQDDDHLCDGAELMEVMWNDYISLLAGYTRKPLYQQGGCGCVLCDSVHDSVSELRGTEFGVDDNHLDFHWINTDDYGIVAWWGHGAETWTQVGVNDHPDGTLLANTDCPALDDTRPSIHIPVSCTNGYPENANNLSYSLLKDGAICSLGPSRVTWYTPMTWVPGLGPLIGDNASYAYYILQKVLTSGKTLGEALFECKNEFGMGFDDGASFMNCTDYNLYGDPSLNPGRGAIGTPGLQRFISPDPDGTYDASWTAAAAAGVTTYELQELREATYYIGYNLTDDAEGGTGNWTCTGRWQQSDQDKHADTWSFRCSTDDGWGGYTMTLNQEFKVTAASTDITFWSRIYYFHEDEYVKFQISKDGGWSWDDLWTFYSFAPATEQVWTPVNGIDFSSYDGEDVQVRFYYNTGADFYDGDANPTYGVFIDDFSITNGEKLNWITLSAAIAHPPAPFPIAGQPDDTYYYRVRTLDGANPGWWSNVESIEVGLPVSFTAASQSGPEDVGTMTITAEIPATSILNITVPFTVTGTATEGVGNDYTITADPITIMAGDLSEDITITVNEDVLDEDDETVIVTMGDPINALQGATTVHTATIQDNDAMPLVAFTAASQSELESIGTMIITTQLSALSGRDVTVPFTLGGTATQGGGSDYTITGSPITITEGNWSVNITITVNNDALVESDETVIVTMGNPTNAAKGAPAVHTATIRNNDYVVPIVTSVSSILVREGKTATFGVKLGSIPGGSATVDVANTVGEPTIDVTGGSALTFTPSNWSTWQTVTLSAEEDSNIEENSATITCSGTGLTSATVTATKYDNDRMRPVGGGGGCFITTARQHR